MINFRKSLEKEEVLDVKKFEKNTDFANKVKGIANSRVYDQLENEYSSDGEKISEIVSRNSLLDHIYSEKETWKINNIHNLFVKLNEQIYFLEKEIKVYNKNNWDDSILLDMLWNCLSWIPDLNKHFHEIWELTKYLTVEWSKKINSTRDLSDFLKWMYSNLRIFELEKPELHFLKNQHTFKEARSFLFLLHYIKSVYTLYNYNYGELYYKLVKIIWPEFFVVNKPDWATKKDELDFLKNTLTLKMNDSLDDFVAQFYLDKENELWNIITHDSVQKSFDKEELIFLDSYIQSQSDWFFTFFLSTNFRMKADDSILRKMNQKQIWLWDIEDPTWSLIEIVFPDFDRALQDVEKDIMHNNNTKLHVLLKKLEPILKNIIATYKVAAYLPSLVWVDAFRETRLRNYYLPKKWEYSSAWYSALHTWYGSFLLDDGKFESKHEVIICTKYDDHSWMRAKQYKKMKENYFVEDDVFSFYEYLQRYILLADPFRYLKESKVDSEVLLKWNITEVRRKWFLQQIKDINIFLINELVQMDDITFKWTINATKVNEYSISILWKKEFWKWGNVMDTVPWQELSERMLEKWILYVIEPLKEKLIKWKQYKKLENVDQILYTYQELLAWKEFSYQEDE